MKAQLYANLEKALQNWVDENGEGEDWPDVVMGPDTIGLMAKAASAVLDACVNSQEYALHAGFFEEPD